MTVWAWFIVTVPLSVALHAAVFMLADRWLRGGR